MDLGTLIGVILGLALIVGSILMDGELVAFLNVPGLFIVVGGTCAAVLIMESLPNVLGSVKVAKNAFFNKPGNATETIKTILELSKIARREGILALEDREVEDEFLAKGLRMAVDGTPREEIRETLQVELVSMKQRHRRGQKVFKFMGATAPSMGMIGTLIGLVQMLQVLDDPSSIGPAMALALLTTFYGAVMAFLICIPIANKLANRTFEETANMTVVIEGIDAIVRGHNAAVIKDKLEARLPPHQRATDDDFKVA